MNDFIPEPSSNIKSDREDSTIASFLEFLSSSERDPNRIDKLESIKEDVEKKREFHTPLPNARRPLMKASIYAIVTRKLRVTGIRAPKYTTAGSKIEDQIAQELLKDGLKDINFPRIHKSIYDRYDTEGSAFVIPMVINGEIQVKMPPLEDIFIDPDGTMLMDEWRGLNEDNIRWFGFRENLKMATFNKTYPKFAGKVSAGSPLETSEYSELDHEGQIGENYSLDDEVTIFHCFSMVNDKPVQISFAGSSATLIEKPKYKYLADNGNPYLPLCVFSFSDEKLGLYSASAVGFTKDGAEALKKNFNHALQNVGRIINAPTYMFGTTDEADIDELSDYFQAIETGLTPVIQRSDPNVTIKSLAPQDVSGVFANIKAQVMDDLSERLGFQLRRQEDNPSMKVSIYVRQERDESDAIKAVDGRNEDVFLRLFQMIYWMKRDLCPHKKRELNIEDINTKVTFKPSDVKKMLKDYEVEFEVDTSMDAKLSFQEKIQANDMIVADIIGLYQANIQDETVAKKVGEFRYRKAVMLGQGKYISKSDYIEAASAAPPVMPEGLDLTSALPAMGGETPGGQVQTPANEPMAFQTQ